MFWQRGTASSGKCKQAKWIYFLFFKIHVCMCSSVKFQQQPNLRQRFGCEITLSPQWFRLVFVLMRWLCCCWFIVKCYSIVLWRLCVLSLFYCALFIVVSSFAVISFGKRELVSYFNCHFMLCDCWCFDMCLFFTVPWVCLQLLNVPFSGHTHLPFVSK